MNATSHAALRPAIGRKPWASLDPSGRRTAPELVWPPDAPKPDVAAFARRLLEPLKGRKFRSVEARLSWNAALGFIIDEDADAESGELMSISRTALVGHRLYQATLSFPAGELPEEEIELFFGSLTIDKVPAATP